MITAMKKPAHMNETDFDPAPVLLSEMKVLLVDDEQNVLRSLARLLRSEDYQVLTAASGEEGLEILSSTQVHLIISDQRMPGMSGTEFLQKTAEVCPDSVRIMLTGYSDIKTAEEAINKVGIFRFLTKPWNDEDLKVTIRQGLEKWLMRDYNRRLLLRIEEQNEELRELNSELEQKVEQRTRELKKAQQKLIQSEKMSSLGLLAGGVAHEINNPLAGIQALAQVLLMENGDGPMAEDLKQIEQAVFQCREIVGNLLSFARQSDDGRREQVFLPAITERTASLVEFELSKKGITLETVFDEDLPLLWANPGQIQQVLINLVINAAQAMEEQGKGRIAVRARAGEDDTVIIEVEDQGPGIPDHIRDKMFDPFFTTKPEGEGTGLGLSITYGIVADHGGAIEVESAPGQGALFRIILPARPKDEKRGERHA